MSHLQLQKFFQAKFETDFVNEKNQANGNMWIYMYITD